MFSGHFIPRFPRLKVMGEYIWKVGFGFRFRYSSCSGLIRSRLTCEVSTN